MSLREMTGNSQITNYKIAQNFNGAICETIALRKIAIYRQSTPWSIKTCRYYFVNSFVQHGPILIIFWRATLGRNSTQLTILLPISL